MRKEMSDFYQDRIDRLINPGPFEYLLFIFIAGWIAYGIVYTVDWYVGKQKVSNYEYTHLDQLVDQCPAVRPELEKALKKGYVNKGDESRLHEIWRNCFTDEEEQKKNDIINKYRKK
jgi:hypothetical protein